MSAGRPSWWTGMIAFVRLRDGALDGVRVEVVRARVDVGEDRRRAALPDGVGGGDERQRRHDHLVARTDARDVQRELQRGRAVRDGDGLGGADALRERGLELAHARALRDPARGDRPRRPRRPRRRAGTAGERDLHHDASASMRVGCVGTPARSPRHHSTRRVRPSSRSTSASKPSSSRARRRVGQAPRDAVHGALGAVLDGEVGAHHLEQHLGEPEQAGLDAAGDVVDHVGHARSAAASRFARAMSPM